MTVVQGQFTTDTEGVDVRGARSRTIMLCLLVLAVAVPWQMRWGVLTDTSWAITMCERMLAGDRLYVDLIEVNPPFTPWLYMPAVALSHTLGVLPEIAIYVYSYAICLLGLGLATLIARQAGFAENRKLFSLLPVFLALLIIFAGKAFSEREHLGIALILPLLALMAWRTAPIEGRTPSLPMAMLAGLSGSILVLVKPYYAVVVLVPALYVAWRRRSIWPLFAVEYWVIGLACVAYLLAVLHFYPQFFTVIYPLLADTYMRVKDPVRVLLIFTPPYALTFWLLRFLRPGLRPSPLVIVFTLASLAAMVPLIYQGKGWPYHAFPAFSLLLMALLLRIAQKTNPIARPALSTAAGLMHKVVPAVIIAVAAIPFMSTDKPDAALVAKINAAVQRPTVTIIGDDIAAGHPLTRMLGGTWVSSYCSDWLAEFALYLSAREARNGNKEAADHYRQIADRYLDGKLAELETKRPDVIVVQDDDVILTELSRRQDYVRFMQGYRQIAEDNFITNSLFDRVHVQVMLRNTDIGQALSPAAASY